jgi:pyocin large subunit-like protein
MLEARKGLPGHQVYALARNAIELNEIWKKFSAPERGISLDAGLLDFPPTARQSFEIGQWWAQRCYEERTSRPDTFETRTPNMNQRDPKLHGQGLVKSAVSDPILTVPAATALRATPLATAAVAATTSVDTTATAVDMPLQVTLDTSDERPIGFTIVVVTSSASPKRVVVKSVAVGGQAEATGKIKAGMTISHINGTDTSGRGMKDVGVLLTSSSQVTLTMASAHPPAP